MATALNQLLSDLLARRVEGGIAGKSSESEPRADATAWTLLALRACRGVEPGSVERSDMADPLRDDLATFQHADGRVPLSPDTSTAYWPTALASIAWSPSATHRDARDRAVSFLLGRSAGLSVPRSPFVGHDSTLVGWSWIQGTHSWVEPTSMALLALALSGSAGHDRCLDAERLLLDRQLEAGGWNYGNTVTFGQQMRAAPDSTGAALTALAARSASRSTVQRSLDYLTEIHPRLRSPLAVGWSVLGLSAWDRRPDDAAEKISAVLGRQATLGAFDSTLLALLAVAWSSPRGMESSVR